VVTGATIEAWSATDAEFRAQVEHAQLGARAEQLQGPGA
jgi:hypothetical protein